MSALNETLFEPFILFHHQQLLNLNNKADMIRAVQRNQYMSIILIILILEVCHNSNSESCETVSITLSFTQCTIKFFKCTGRITNCQKQKTQESLYSIYNQFFGQSTQSQIQVYRNTKQCFENCCLGFTGITFDKRLSYPIMRYQDQVIQTEILQQNLKFIDQSILKDSQFQLKKKQVNIIFICAIFTSISCIAFIAFLKYAQTHGGIFNFCTKLVTIFRVEKQQVSSFSEQKINSAQKWKRQKDSSELNSKRPFTQRINNQISRQRDQQIEERCVVTQNNSRVQQPDDKILKPYEFN